MDAESLFSPAVPALFIGGRQVSEAVRAAPYRCPARCLLLAILLAPVALLARTAGFATRRELLRTPA